MVYFLTSVNRNLVPEKYFGAFADYFCQAADKMEAAGEGSSHTGSLNENEIEE
jgi:hypothetical protein